MAFAGSRQRAVLNPPAEPNVIAFINVLLVLVIIFMVTAPAPTTDLRVDLAPPVQGPAAEIEPAIVDLRNAPDGFLVFVGAEQTRLDALGARALAYILAENPALSAHDAHVHSRVFVRSELDVAYAPVDGAVEALRLSGFHNVSIGAQRAQET